MSRPQRCRRICQEPLFTRFAPSEFSCTDVIELTLDEYEVVRLVDLESVNHEQCARQMDISRTTVTEIYASARKKIADSIVNGKMLVIQGGRYKLCEGQSSCCKFRKCRQNLAEEK